MDIPLSTIGRELLRILDRPTKMYSSSGDFYGVLSAVLFVLPQFQQMLLCTRRGFANGISVVGQSESPLNLIIIRTSFLALIALHTYAKMCGRDLFSKLL